jgi:hypothetical protein
MGCQSHAVSNMQQDPSMAANSSRRFRGWRRGPAIHRKLGDAHAAAFSAHAGVVVQK